MNSHLQPPHDTFVALGSNVEPRVRNLLSALHLLARTPGLDIHSVSAAYRSAAHTLDGRPQADYINAVARLRTDLQPDELLQRCLEIEHALGRIRETGTRWQPRTIDLDLLLHSSGRFEGRQLEVPHPRMRERLFVLLPLSDLMQDSRYIVEFDETVDQLIARCDDRAAITKTIVRLGNYK